MDGLGSRSTANRANTAFTVKERAILTPSCFTLCSATRHDSVQSSSRATRVRLGRALRKVPLPLCAQQPTLRLKRSIIVLAPNRTLHRLQFHERTATRSPNDLVPQLFKAL